MPDFNDHPVFSWLGKAALGLPIYAELFRGATITLIGESPYIDAKQAGIELVLNADNSVRAVHLYAQDVEGFGAYASPLPAGIKLSNIRADVRATLGDPAISMDAGGVGLMAIEFAFDRYEAGNHYLRFEYLTGDSGIRLVTTGTCSD